MADLAKQLRQLQDAQRLRELAQQYGYSQQDINTLRQALPQAAGAMMPPPAQMPQYVPPQGQVPPAQMRDYTLKPKDYGALPPVPMPSVPAPSQMSPYMQNLTNPGLTMQQNYIDPAIIEQMYYRGLLSR